jgi:hypothetical protein
MSATAREESLRVSKGGLCAMNVSRSECGLISVLDGAVIASGDE